MTNGSYLPEKAIRYSIASDNGTILELLVENTNNGVKNDCSEKITGFAVALELLMKNLLIGKQAPTAACLEEITFGGNINMGKKIVTTHLGGMGLGFIK